MPQADNSKDTTEFAINMQNITEGDTLFQSGIEDIEEAAKKLAQLSLRDPQSININLLRRALGQAAVDRIAGQFNRKADITSLNWEKLIENFCLRFESVSTRKMYALNIRKWVTWCKEQGIDPLEANGDHADSYAAFLRTARLSSSTINLRINAVSSLYTHLVKRGHLPATPFMAVRRVSHQYIDKPVPTATQMINAVWYEPTSVRIAVDFMLSTGVRIGAFATLGISVSGEWQAYSKGNMHAGSINDKQLIKNVRTFVGCEEWKKANWLTVRIRRAFIRVGLPGSAHQCRHRFALNLYKATNHNTEAVRRALGHKDLGVTTAYLQGLKEWE